MLVCAGEGESEFLSHLKCGKVLSEKFEIQFLGNEAIFTCALFCTFKKFILCFITGALISHEKLLLQINTEREIGDMDYKLGQVCLNFKLDFN